MHETMAFFFPILKFQDYCWFSQAVGDWAGPRDQAKDYKVKFIAVFSEQKIKIDVKLSTNISSHLEWSVPL